MLRLPPILRPRLTWRYILCSLVVLYVTYCFLFSSPLFASNLPRYTGPYGVGTVDIEAPIVPRSISDFKRKGTNDPAFPLDTVLFSLYYPATNLRKSKPLHHWIPKPISVTAEGYLSFGHVNNFLTNSIVTGALWSLAGGITIPAAVDVPLDDPLPALEVQDNLHLKANEKSTNGFPALVFSHGFASSRTDYTHYLGELASRGYIVAAIEHRDGSGPGSVVMRTGSPDRTVFPFGIGDIAENPDLDVPNFKKAQLDFREAEVLETVKVLKLINDGKGEDVFHCNPRKEGQDLKDWAGKIDMEQVTIGGHSFGATLALQALKSSPTLPFKGGIALDPGKSSGPLNTDIDSPLLIIHSNSWSSRHSLFYGRPHFDVVKDLVLGVIERGFGGWFVTSLGTSHPSVTDAPLIEPLLLSWTTGATIDVKQGVEEYVRASYSFLTYQATGKRTGLLAQNVSHPEYKDPKDAPGKHALDKEFRRYWEVHVAPES